MSDSKCDKCGETVADIDAGFSPGLHEMKHDCGGTWRRVDAPLEMAANAIRGAGYDVSRSSDNQRLIIELSDAGDDDPEAAAALEEIRALVAEHGCSAEWTGSGNTESDGSSTSDVAVTPNGRAAGDDEAPDSERTERADHLRDAAKDRESERPGRSR